MNQSVCSIGSGFGGMTRVMLCAMAAALLAVVIMSAGASAQTAKPDELNTAIRGASDYLNGKIPKGSKIVVLNVQSNSPELSDYIIDELIANAVNDRFFTVVSRKQLDAIREEQKLQMSGEVDDKDALAIGRLFGAQTIISGVVSTIGNLYSLRFSALEVQTAKVQGQYNRNITSSQIISSLVSGGGYSAARNAPTAQTGRPGASTPTVVKGIAVTGGNLTEKLDWLQRNADSHNTYLIEVSDDENIAPYKFQYPNLINITIVMRGVGANRNIRLGSNGSMFSIYPNVTFILDNNITLYGHNQNTGSLVSVFGGIFRMNAGTGITGNNGGRSGGGVYLSSGAFEMNGGTIAANAANSGGGVYVSGGTFAMNDGNIAGNAANDGGGVYISKGTVNTNGGAIHTNTAQNSGGGVFASGGTFNMRGCVIARNTAVRSGGGVYVSGSLTKFAKTGGVITGYKSDPNDGNAVIDGTPLPRSGHAVFVSATKRKETTAGPTVYLSHGEGGRNSGAWDQ